MLTGFPVNRSEAGALKLVSGNFIRSKKRGIDMIKQVLVSSLIASALFMGNSLAVADSRGNGEHINNQLDRKGDRIEHRLDQKGDRINRRLDRASDRAAAQGKDGLSARLDRKGDRIDRRLDHKGDNINHRMDRKGNRIERHAKARPRS